MHTSGSNDVCRPHGDGLFLILLHFSYIRTSGPKTVSWVEEIEIIP